MKQAALISAAIVAAGALIAYHPHPFRGSPVSCKTSTVQGGFGAPSCKP